jgi:dihydroorotate dehydrogenase (fumarate)
MEIPMNLSTSYLGLELTSPYIAGASPMSAQFDYVKRLEDAGCAGVVLHSLFEEQITMATSGMIRHRDPFDPEMAGPVESFPPAEDYAFQPDEYANHIRRLKAAVRIPVIASLNGTTAEAWLRHAAKLQDAGADALELNMYRVVTDLDAVGMAIESQLRDVVSEMKRLLRIPIAIKLTPFYTAFGNVARQLDRAGADGLVLFNRFYQPDIDIKSISTVPSVELSRSAELMLRLRWLANLYGRLDSDLAASGGIETPDDGIKALLAGADAVQLVSAILRHGPGHFRMMREGLERWMAWHHFNGLDEVRGRLSTRSVEDPEAVERASYIRTLHSWKV